MSIKPSMKNKRGSARKTSDFGQGSDPHTLILKKKEWKLEVSRNSVWRFFGRHKKALIAALAIIIAGVVTRYVLVGFADTADFYPSSCLGNWENVQNALGKPDLPPGAPASAFTTFNSAVLGTSTAQMFCGNFSGDTNIDVLNGKSFQEADLVLSWSFVFPDDSSTTGDGLEGDGGNTSSSPAATSSSTPTSSPSTPPSGGGNDGGDGTSPSVSTSTPTSTSTSNPVDDSSSSTDATTDTSTSTSSSTADATSSPVTPVISTSTSIDDSSSTPTDTSATTTTTATTSDDTDVPTSTPPAADPDSTDVSSSDPGPTSWLHDLVGVAYADETSSIETTGSTTEVSYVQTATSSVPTGTPINVNTAAFQNITLPSSTGDAVLSIVYSTDGVTWQPIVNIDSANWQEGRYQIPISSWAELQNLQIAFVGLGASDTPQVFLDAVGVEVSYADAQPDLVASDTSPDEPSPAPAVTPPPAPTELPPVQAFKQVFDPFAGQQCSVAPFSESIAAGGGGSFLLTMTPPPTNASSTTSTLSQAPKEPFLYDASIGSLPDGITATIAPEGPGVDAIGISAVSSVAAGSYNAVVVYKERQHDGTIAPNFCQFNLVVTQAPS
jgi:hypothetical protein